MKANRTPRSIARFVEDDAGVSEAVGYIITFGISTIVLVTSLQAFLVIQGHTHDIAVDRTVKEVAAQVAFAVDEALRAGSTYPDASFSMALNVPTEIGGEGYRISLYETHVWVEATDAIPAYGGSEEETRGRAKANYVQRAGVEVLCKNPQIQLDGGVCSMLSQEGQVTIAYDDVGADIGVFLKRNT